MAKIFRYTPEAQKLLGAKTKAEPWMHVVLNEFPDVGGAIYVWDTREIIELIDNNNWYSNDMTKKLVEAGIPHAKDNKQPLKGKGASDFTNVFGTGFNLNKAGKVFVLYLIDPKDNSDEKNVKVLLVTRDIKAGEHAKAEAYSKYGKDSVRGYADTVKNFIGASSVRSRAIQDAILKFMHNEQQNQ
jgi:hypothetical protein